MRSRLFELQDKNIGAKKLQAKEHLKNRKDVETVVHYKSFLYVLEIIYFKPINHYQNNALIGYFEMDKTLELIAKKY